MTNCLLHHPGCYITHIIDKTFSDDPIFKIVSMQMNGVERDGEKNGKNNHDINSHSDMLVDNANGSSTNQVSVTGSIIEIVRQQRFDVGPRYTDLKFIGEGAYGKY